jgi:hypothetical protein
MLYRRKIILALLQATQRILGAISISDFHKILYLFCQKQIEPTFEFLPLNECYSFTAEFDISVLANKGLIAINDNHLSSNTPDDYAITLKMNDRMYLRSIPQRGATRITIYSVIIL